MSGPVRVLALVVERSRRARLVEEWRSDMHAARALGLSRFDVTVATVRVAGFLAVVRVRDRIRRPGTWGDLVGAGVALGLAAVVLDVPIDEFAPVVIPFVVLAVGVRAWSVVQAWIERA